MILLALALALAGDPPCDTPAACATAGRAAGFVDGRPSADAPDPAGARDLLERACAGGEAEACVDRARMVQRGVGGDADPAAAAEAFRAACDRGVPSGCLHLSKAHQVGLGVAADAGEVRRRAEQACADGWAPGCNALALSLHLGTGGEKGLARAHDLYTAACADGFAPACENLGRLYEGGLPDVADRVERLRTGCDGGSLSACAWLGELLEPDDAEGARRAYAPACDGKLARGCRGLAFLVLDGRIEGGVDEALERLEGACEVGEPLACARLGDLREAGEAVPRDWLGAYQAREVACRSGHGPACARAAWQRRKGKGPEKSKEAAAELEARACTLGVLDACP